MKKVYCLTPVYDDWESFEVLLSHTENLQEKYAEKYTFSIVVVNDGSTDVKSINSSKIDICILNLKINIGHQRAIATGLQFIYNEVDQKDYVIVLDSDGEDKPEDMMLLIEKAEKEKNKKIIFAQRKKRQEAVLFKLGYLIYKKIFYFFTGQKINFGNFSIIPEELLSKVVHQSNIWNHYSGGIIQSRIPFEKILLDRGKRFHGVSKMNFYNLTIHGLSSISVYFDFFIIKNIKIYFVRNITLFCFNCIHIVPKNIYKQCNSRMGIKFNPYSYWNNAPIIYSNFNRIIDAVKL